jgi:hypothetical protein
MRYKTHTSLQQPVPSEPDVPVVRSKDSVRQNRLLFWMKAHNLIDLPAQNSASKRKMNLQ